MLPSMLYFEVPRLYGPVDKGNIGKWYYETADYTTKSEVAIIKISNEIQPNMVHLILYSLIQMVHLGRLPSCLVCRRAKANTRRKTSKNRCNYGFTKAVTLSSIVQN